MTRIAPSECSSPCATRRTLSELVLEGWELDAALLTALAEGLTDLKSLTFSQCCATSVSGAHFLPFSSIPSSSHGHFSFCGRVQVPTLQWRRIIGRLM